MKTAVLLCALLWSLVDSQTAPYVRFNNMILPNHGYVDLSQVGEAGSNSVQCHTDLTSCCTSGITNAVDRPDWYLPGSGAVPLPFSGGIYQARGVQRNDLRRRNNVLTPSGIYRCEIPTDDGDDGFVRETVYVGIYSSGGGDVTIPGGITAMISGDEFTLTCISTGGPATTATWTRDSVTVTEGTETVLDDPVTAQYTHTLTGSTVGDYACTVTNDISSDTVTLTVQVVDPPTNVMAERESATSILVSWSPPDPLGDTTGYRIDYARTGGSSVSVNVTGGDTREQELTGLQNGAIYTISIVAISQGFPSESVVAMDAVHLDPDEPIVSVGTRTPTSISISWTISSDSVVTGYMVMWGRDTSLGCPDVNGGSATITHSRTSYTVNELEEDSRYSITVTASNDAGSSEDTVTAMTLEAAPSVPPTSVSTSSDSSSSITVQWEMVPCIHRNGDITGYIVQYGIQGQSNPQTKSVIGADTLMTTITDLMPSTTYTIQVAAVNGPLIGMYSDEVVQQTNDVISMVSVVPSSSITLIISWTVDVGVMVESYTITYANTDTDCFTDSDDTTDIASDMTMYRLTGLEEGTEYSITVTALLADEDTGEAEGMGTTAPAAPSEPPSNVGATSTSSTITVQWEMVPCISRNGDITGYSVRYTEVESGSTQTVSVPGGDTLMTTIEDVMSSTNYSIEVAAVNDNLIGIYSDPVIVETPQSVFLSLDGDIIPNHGYVVISDIGSTASTALICNTNHPATVDNNRHSGGEWFAPDTTKVNRNFVPGFIRNRGPMEARLLRSTATDPRPPVEGIYHCEIEDDTDTEQTVYVGLYNSGRGSIMSSEVVSLTVDSDLNGPNPQFTLTCISTGGPATTVTWTRDLRNVVGTRSIEVVNGVTAEYTNTLTVTGSLGGLYTCTVTNEVTPAGASDTFTVEVASAPTGVVAMQVNITSVRVSWSPPDPLGDTTGYIVSYNNSTVTIADSSTDNLILTGLVMEASYTISIVAISDHFNSEAVQDEVTLVLPPVEPTVDTGAAELGSTTITLSWTVPDGPVVTNSLVMWELASSGGSSARAVRDDGSGSSELLDGNIRSYTIEDLRSSTSYNITVILINPAGNSSMQVTLSTEAPSEPSKGSEQNNAAAVAGGVIAAIIVLAVITALAILVYCLYRRRDGSTKYSPTDKSSIHYSVPGDTVSSEDAPCVVRFPEDTHVQEGEGVVFQVEVTGVPRPKLRWYHDGEEVVADYSKELSEDGSLTMPSAETKHSGVYQLVAVNSAGRVEREVKLTVEPEGEEPVTEEPSYDNVTLSGAVSVSIFGNHVEQRHSKNNKPFKDEYEGLPTHGDKAIAIATSPNNKLKNRFANICVYDDNRVVLKPVNQYDSDYVNASYVDGHSMSRKFIATQGPLPKTVVDFWRLVWQERAPTVVMITNLVEGTKIKCQQYWPESGAQTFGPFQVTISDQQILADYTIRSLQVQLKGSSERGLKVTQFHFTAWPDHGVPDYATPILAFHRRVTKEHKTGPIVVHCSAGVGRTGTFITIDRMLDQAAKEGVVDIPDTIASIRKQRTKMVQTVDQYVFIHDAILEAVTCGDTQIVSGDLRSVLNRLQRKGQSGKTEMETQFAVLDQVSPNPRDAKVNVAKKNPKKNRSKDFLPLDKWRVVLKGETPDYVNASVAHGYKQQRAFIIAQSPMQSTARDFWKMVSDRKCGVIVMLNNLVENGKEVCYQYWPSSGTQTYGEFTVELLGEEELSGFTLRTFGAFNSKSGKSHQVSQFHITNWAPDGSCGNLKTVTDVIEEVGKVQRRTGNHPVLAHCSDTVSRSGMFCAIATTIERCKTEGVVDVFQVVKALRVQKPGAVRTVLQYRVIFEAVLEYLDSFALYSNF